MMLTRVFFIVTFCTLSIGTIDAQTRADKSFVVTIENDTIYGKIEYETKLTPDLITFAVDTVVLELKPVDIRAFHTNEASFISEAVLFDDSKYITSKIFLNELDYLDEPKLIQKQLFLKTIQKGEYISIYEFLGPDKKRQFFILDHDSGQIITLYNNQFKKRIDGSVTLTYSERYKGQLNELLEQCTDIQKLTAQLPYTSHGLASFVADYEQCIKQGKLKSKARYKREFDQIRVRLGALAGVYYSNFDLSSRINALLDQADLTDVKAPTIGLVATVVFPSRRRKLLLNNDITFKQIISDGTSSEVVNSLDSTFAELEFDFALIRVSNMLRYKWLGNQWDVFANIGFSNSWMIKKESHIKEYRTLANQELAVQEGDVLPFFSTHELGFLLGIGIDFGRIVTEFRYEQSEGISKNFAVDSKVESFNLLVTYYFQ